MGPFGAASSNLVTRTAMVKEILKITCTCPNGHRVRGEARLRGSRVRCPKCRVAFVFPAARPAAGDNAVSDTSVMRILGDLSHTGIPVVNKGIAVSGEINRLRTCTRCGQATSKSLAICSHCSCYLGIIETGEGTSNGGTGNLTTS